MVGQGGCGCDGCEEEEEGEEVVVEANGGQEGHGFALEVVMSGRSGG